MFTFFVGVAVGAAFAPFWMKVWGMIKGAWNSYKDKK